MKWQKLHDVMRETENEDFGRKKCKGTFSMYADEEDDQSDESVDLARGMDGRFFDMFSHQILGDKGGNGLLDECMTLAETATNIFDFADPSDFDSKEVIFSRLFQIASNAIAAAYSQNMNGINKYQGLKAKYQSLLERHRAAVKGHMAEILNTRQRKFDMTEYEISDISLYDEVNLLDDETRDLCHTVINERLRQLLGAPSRYLRNLIASLFAEGEGPSWLTSNVSADELADAKERSTFLDHKLKLALARVEELERDIETSALQTAESHPDIETEAENDASHVVEYVTPPEVLDELEELRAKCAAFEETVANKDREFACHIQDMEVRLSSSQLELETIREHPVASVVDGSSELEEVTSKMDIVAEELKAEVGRHSETRKELKNLRKQFASTVAQVQAIEDKYAQVCADLADERKKRQQIVNQLRSTECALQQMQRKRSADGKCAIDTDIDPGVEWGDRPWRSVFDRLFKDATDKTQRMEKLRETWRSGGMQHLVDVLETFWPKVSPIELVEPPTIIGRTVSSEMARYLESLKKEFSPRRESPPPQPEVETLSLQNFGIFATAIPKVARKPSLTKVHTSEPNRQCTRGTMKSSTSTLYKLDMMDLVSQESWKEKCRRKHVEVGNQPMRRTENSVMPSLSIGWCLPSLTK